MNHRFALHLWLGVADLVIAIGMASLSLTYPDSGCMAGLAALMCWMASVPVAVAALWLLVHPRSGSWFAMLIGVGALIIAAMVLREGPSDAADDPGVWLLLLAGFAQLPIG